MSGTRISPDAGELLGRLILIHAVVIVREAVADLADGISSLVAAAPKLTSVQFVRVIVSALAAVLLLAGCGSSTQTAVPAASPSSSSGLPVCTADDITVDGGFGTDPKVTIPDTCSPPTTLVIKDLVEGSGTAAKAGSTVTANYELTTWSDKKVLDSSFSRGQPFPVENLGKAQVIEGWNQGLIGMKQGTRRLLIVPPSLGYGEGGNGIAPNETLVFVIDAVKVS